MKREDRALRRGDETLGRRGGALPSRPREGRGLSRRSFLEFSTIAAAQAAVVGVARAAEGDAGATVPNASPTPAGAASIMMKVNGVERSLSVEPRTTLAEALRGPLGLTGVKIACDRGACSACTVWLDGAPVCSCMTLAVEVGQRAVATIEGLAQGDTLHPVQEAFIAHDALQCGFCTPGMIMSCAALLARDPEPSAEDVKSAIAGHYCRCGTYPHVVAATLAAAKARRS